MKLRDTTIGYHGASEDEVGLKEICIGWFGPSDEADVQDGDSWWAASFAVQEANQQSAGAEPATFAALPIRLAPRWAPDPWRAGVSLLARMVYDEQPLALLGSVDSASTHLAEQVVAKANLPLVSPIATDPSVTLAGVSWMFSCAPSDSTIARVLVDSILARLATPSSRLLLLTTTDHESRMTTREVVREFSRRGRLPDLRLDLPPAVGDLDETMRAAVALKPDTILIIAGAGDAAQLVHAVRKTQGNVAVFGGQTMGRTLFAELAGSDADGVRFPLLFAPDRSDSDTARFIKTFTGERGHAPDYTAAFAYDATRLLIEAIHRAGPNRARIREAILELSPWQGIAGGIHFDGTGQNLRSSLCLGTFRDGVVVAIDASAFALCAASVTTP